MTMIYLSAFIVMVHSSLPEMTGLGWRYMKVFGILYGSQCFWYNGELLWHGGKSIEHVDDQFSFSAA